MERLMERVEKQGAELLQKVEAKCEELSQRIERITANVDGNSPRRDTENHGQIPGASRKTMNSFLAKVMAEAEGADPKQIDQMLAGLTIEQRLAVKMQMVKAGML
jgi:hypothetical protein